MASADKYNSHKDSENNYYILTLNGEIIDSNEEMIAELGNKGWSCLAALS